MSTHLKLSAIIGSLRAESVNRQVFDSACHLLPADTILTEAPVHDVPLFNEDVEAVGDPDGVVRLKSLVLESDAVLIFTPEYNGSIPGVTKNAVDWLSRQRGEGPIAQKPVGVVVAAPGGGGSGLQSHLTASLSGVAGAVFEPVHGIVSIHHKLDGGRLVDEPGDDLKEWLGRFCSFVRGLQSPESEN